MGGLKKYYFGKKKGIIWDADALAFISATGITDTIQKSSINTLVVSLKSAGIWTKMKAIYPVIGGTSFTHKFNLKDPRDLDAAYRLVFTGTITHDSNGWLTNSSSYANTFLNANAVLSQNSAHVSYYSRTNSVNQGVMIGAQVSSTNNLRIAATYSPAPLVECNNGAAGYGGSSTVNNLGFFLTSRIVSTGYKFYKNGNSLGLQNNPSSAPPNCNIFIGASSNNNSPSSYSSTQCAFATIGEGLSDTEVSGLYAAIQSFQTNLSRNI